jgi:hypothetical protein
MAAGALCVFRLYRWIENLNTALRVSRTAAFRTPHAARAVAFLFLDTLEELREVELVIVRLDRRQALKALPSTLLAFLQLARHRRRFPQLDQPLVSEH